MKRLALWAVAGTIVLSTAICTSGRDDTPAVRERVVTVVVEATSRPTARPTSRPAPTRRPTAVPEGEFDFYPGSGWVSAPEYNPTCEFECESWLYESGDDLLLQVYFDGIVFGIPVDGDTYTAGTVMAETMNKYGVPLSVMDTISGSISEVDLGTHFAGGWAYDISVNEDMTLIMVGVWGP